jgi:hypothetical protein
MLLRRVIYHMFESETPPPMDATVVALDGEVELELEGASQFFSWQQSPDPDGDFVVAMRGSTFFVGGNLPVRFDASGSELWRRLVDREIRIEVCDDQDRATCIWVDSDRAYICAGHDECWEADLITVAKSLPPHLRPSLSQ